MIALHGHGPVEANSSTRPPRPGRQGESKSRANILGKTIPGFNKDHQQFLLFRLGNIRGAKAWQRWIAPLVSSMEAVLAWVRAYRALRKRLGAEAPLCATWVNIAFPYRAIALLKGRADAHRSRLPSR